MTELPIDSRLSSDNEFGADYKSKLLNSTVTLTEKMDKKMKKMKINDQKKGVNIKLLEKFLMQRQEEFIQDWTLPKVEMEIKCAERDPFQYDMMEAMCVRHIFQKSLGMQVKPGDRMLRDTKKSLELM